MAKEVFVGNLPYTTTNEELTQHFAAYNPTQAKVITDRDSGRSRGFGFVAFDNDEDADKAIAELNGKDLGDRQLTVRESTPRQ